ncbi:MAG: tyrosine-type recombinase/integrase [Bdellovibrionales bacterium]
MNQTLKKHTLTESKILSESELKTMLKAIKPYMEQSLRTKRHLHYINDFYLILIGSLTGMRVSEIASVKISDIGESSIQVIGKGGKMRSVPLGRKGMSAVTDLLQIKTDVMDQPTDPNQRLFLNRNGKPFTRFSIERRFSFWKKRCGITRKINFHSLRHYYATYLLNNSFLLHEVQKMLGHSSPTTTAIYLHFTKETKARINSAL